NATGALQIGTHLARCLGQRPGSASWFRAPTPQPLYIRDEGRLLEQRAALVATDSEDAGVFCARSSYREPATSADPNQGGLYFQIPHIPNFVGGGRAQGCASIVCSFGSYGRR